MKDKIIVIGLGSVATETAHDFKLKGHEVEQITAEEASQRNIEIVTKNNVIVPDIKIFETPDLRCGRQRRIDRRKQNRKSYK